MKAERATEQSGRPVSKEMFKPGDLPYPKKMHLSVGEDAYHAGNTIPGDMCNLSGLQQGPAFYLPMGCFASPEPFIAKERSFYEEFLHRFHSR
jgi:hypothetical protein